jgi:glycine/D-amino acid oxidase-like deaminating enzyme
VPVVTFASMTRPLTDTEMEVFGGQLDWGLTPADPGGTTLRMTQDRRLLVRNQYDYAGRYGVSVRIMDGCPVERFTREGRSVSLTLRSQGALMDVSATKVLLCTNAFTPEFGFLRHRIVPVVTFASMTRPLTDTEMEVFGGQLDWGLTPPIPAAPPSA